MIEKSGVLTHLDPKGDRTGKSNLEFDGWIVADKPAKAVWLPAPGGKSLTICERPDVRRVFPNRTTLGFSGKSRGRDIGPKGLRLAVRVGDETRTDDSLWLQQLPSLDPDLLQQNARQFGLEQASTIAGTVPSFSVATLLKRHHLTELDFLVIDTEGWDWRILRQFDMTILHPKLILYEHQHLSPQEGDQAHQFLAQHTYGWAETEEGDTVAWRFG